MSDTDKLKNLESKAEGPIDNALRRTASGLNTIADQGHSGRWVAAIIIVALIGLGWVSCSNAEIIATATTSKGVTITLTDEPCAVPAVTNLPQRAMWEESGARFEGCFGSQLDGIWLNFYFDDRTVFGLPARSFRKVMRL